MLAALPLLPMFGHLCFVPVLPGAGELAAGDEVADRCDLAAGVDALLEALAMVRPRARLAPSAPAPTAVPMSGRVILTWFSFAFARRDRPAPGRSPVGPPHQ
jgi:hypothetical protein